MPWPRENTKNNSNNSSSNNKMVVLLLLLLLPHLLLRMRHLLLWVLHRRPNPRRTTTTLLLLLLLLHRHLVPPRHLHCPARTVTTTATTTITMSWRQATCRRCDTKPRRDCFIDNNSINMCNNYSRVGNRIEDDMTNTNTVTTRTAVVAVVLAPPPTTTTTTTIDHNDDHWVVRQQRWNEGMNTLENIGSGRQKKLERITVQWLATAMGKHTHVIYTTHTHLEWERIWIEEVAIYPTSYTRITNKNHKKDVQAKMTTWTDGTPTLFWSGISKSNLKVVEHND